MLSSNNQLANTLGQQTKNFFLEINIQSLRYHDDELKIECEKYSMQPKVIGTTETR